MKLLLDTHVVLWWLLDAPELAEETKERLETEPEVYVSAATAWELAIKQATGKLEAPDDLLEVIGSSGLTHLPIRFDHSIVAGRLPLIHRDPFDRMLIAQSQCEAMTLVTRDPEILKYDVTAIALP